MNIKVPTRAPGPAYWLLTDAHVDRWTDLYPELSVIREVKVAMAWLDTHPTRRKTAGRMSWFFESWLNRERKKLPPAPVPRGGWLGLRSPRWECPHVEPCNNRVTCDLRNAQNRPRKDGATT